MLNTGTAGMSCLADVVVWCVGGEAGTKKEKMTTRPGDVVFTFPFLFFSFSLFCLSCVCISLAFSFLAVIF
jgi:hypothetical protein